jgi:TRAP-type mannitol/chloroaromatic compound transport system permease small subunit
MAHNTESHFIRAVEWLSLWSGQTFSWMILGMIGALVIEVVMRYVFSSPTSWAYELTTMFYGSYCVLVGAYTHIRGGHIRMDAVYNHFSMRTRAKMDFITGWLAIGYLVMLIWVSWKFAVVSWNVREYSTATTWPVPLYPFKFTLLVGTILLLLQQIVVMIRDYRVMKTGEDSDSIPGKE